VCECVCACVNVCMCVCVSVCAIDVWFVMIGQYLKIWNLRVQKYINIEKIIFKVVQMNFLEMHINKKKIRFDIFTVGNVQNIFIVQMNFLAMHINNQKISFYIFMVGNVQNIFMEHDLNILMIFGIK